MLLGSRLGAALRLGPALGTALATPGVGLCICVCVCVRKKNVSWVNFWKERKKSIEVINKAYAGVGTRVGLLFIFNSIDKREREKVSWDHLGTKLLTNQSKS